MSKTLALSLNSTANLELHIPVKSLFACLWLSYVVIIDTSPMSWPWIVDPIKWSLSCSIWPEEMYFCLFGRTVESSKNSIKNYILSAAALSLLLFKDLLTDYLSVTTPRPETITLFRVSLIELSFWRILRFDGLPVVPAIIDLPFFESTEFYSLIYELLYVAD